MSQDDAGDLETQALQRSRADLETLIDTTPVCVVVFELNHQRV